MSLKTRVFLIRRLGTDPLVLHSFGPGLPFFRNAGRLFTARASRSQSDPGRPRVEIEGRCRELPSPAEAAGVKKTLESAIKRAVREWTLDLGFISRVAVSSLAFIVLYLFFSIVVRDPIPILDEFAMGCIGAFMSWRLMARRSLASPAAAGFAEELEEALYSAGFSQSAAAGWAQDRLAELASAARPEYADAAWSRGSFDIAHWLEKSPSVLDPSDREELAELRDALVNHLSRVSFFGVQNRAVIESRARRKLGLDKPLGPSRSGAPLDEVATLHALLLKIDSELVGN